MRSFLVFLVLLVVHYGGRLFYRHESEWVGDPPPEPWRHNRLVAILNHTSLYEALFAGLVPKHFLWAMARHGVVPVAAKTIARPVVGRFWKMIAGNVVSISRERDHTWSEVLRSIHDEKSMVIILPEGRMKRANGLDSFGRPLVVRGGVAEILQTIPSGRFLLAYSLGLHHIQIPGQRLPRLFQPVRMRLESLDIAKYREAMERRAASLGGAPDEAFKRAVVADLTRRRDLYCDAASWGERVALTG